MQLNRLSGDASTTGPQQTAQVVTRLHVHTGAELSRLNKTTAFAICLRAQLAQRWHLTEDLTQFCSQNGIYQGCCTHALSMLVASSKSRGAQLVLRSGRKQHLLFQFAVVHRYSRSIQVKALVSILLHHYRISLI